MCVCVTTCVLANAVVTCDSQVCRFRAKLANVDVDGTDASRDFVVNYFLADDTLSVFEPQVHSSSTLATLYYITITTAMISTAVCV
jgi:DUF1126 PH-like domain